MTRQRALPLYIVLVGCLTAGVIAACLVVTIRMPPAQLLHWAPVGLLFIALGILGSQREVLISESSSHHMGTVAHVAALILLPYQMAVLAIGGSKATTELFIHFKRGRRFRAVPLNTGATVLANAAAGGAFHTLHGSNYLWLGDLRAVQAFPALAALGILYFVIEASTVAGAITLASRERPWSSLHHLMGGAFLPEVSLILVGVLFGVLGRFSPIMTLFVIVPVIFSIRAFESLQRLREETKEAVLKMAEHIDERDHGTGEHSKRLEQLTRRLALETGKILPEDIESIALASRVHDLGKIGIGNDILLKDGPLTAEQRQNMEKHPVIGADILASYSAFGKAVPIVRHHHERWDGTGYPDGLQGEQIPIGSRIIAIVDAYDAMTSDRSYRAGMKPEIAVEHLRDGMWTQFDPDICKKFIDLLIKDGVYQPSQPAPDLRLVDDALSSAS